MADPAAHLFFLIDGSDLNRTMDGSDLYALRLDPANLSRLCQHERLDRPL